MPTYPEYVPSPLLGKRVRVGRYSGTLVNVARTIELSENGVDPREQLWADVTDGTMHRRVAIDTVLDIHAD